MYNMEKINKNKVANYRAANLAKIKISINILLIT